MITRAPATVTPIASVSPEAKREAQQRATNLRNLTKTITQNLEKWFSQFQEIWDNRDWEKLGYNDWDHYCQEEITRIRLAPEIELGVIEMMRNWGMSQRDMAAATGLSQSTVFNRIKALTSAGVQLPKQIKSSQGKQVKAEKPEGKAREGGRVKKEDRKPKPELPAPVSTDTTEIPPPSPTNGTTHDGRPIHDIVSDANMVRDSYAAPQDFDDAIESLIPHTEEWFDHAPISVQTASKSLAEMRVLLQTAGGIWNGIPDSDRRIALSHAADSFPAEIQAHIDWINDILRVVTENAAAKAEAKMKVDIEALAPQTEFSDQQ